MEMPITLTAYQSQVFAWELTRRAASDSIESLGSTLVDAQIDLNPHQVEAALFACQNPLSRGVILADEVEARRNTLIEQLEEQLEQRIQERLLFNVEWVLQ
jgi:hypothetical protein